MSRKLMYITSNRNNQTEPKEVCPLIGENQWCPNKMKFIVSLTGCPFKEHYRCDAFETLLRML